MIDPLPHPHPYPHPHAPLPYLHPHPRPNPRPNPDPNPNPNQAAPTRRARRRFARAGGIPTSPISAWKEVPHLVRHRGPRLRRRCWRQRLQLRLRLLRRRREATGAPFSLSIASPQTLPPAVRYSEKEPERLPHCAQPAACVMLHKLVIAYCNPYISSRRESLRLINYTGPFIGESGLLENEPTAQIPGPSYMRISCGEKRNATDIGLIIVDKSQN